MPAPQSCSETAITAGMVVKMHSARRNATQDILPLISFFSTAAQFVVSGGGSGRTAAGKYNSSIKNNGEKNSSPCFMISSSDMDLHGVLFSYKSPLQANYTMGMFERHQVYKPVGTHPFLSTPHYAEWQEISPADNEKQQI